jgi:hypothetical protein
LSSFVPVSRHAMPQAEILEIQSEDFQEKSIPVLKDVLETGMKFWSQFGVEL